MSTGTLADAVIQDQGDVHFIDASYAFYVANGAPALDYAETELRFLVARGVTRAGDPQDMWRAFLAGLLTPLSSDDDLSEMKRVWWAAGAPLT